MGLLKGKTAIITGASRGIGQETAKIFAQEGANLVICARNEKGLKETAKICESFGVKILCVIADVTKHKDMSAFVEKGVEEFGTIDIAVSNAGISKDSPFLRMKEEDFDSVIDTNLKGAYNFSQVISRHFRKNMSGRLIFISSVVAFHGNNYQANYAASKGGLIAFSKSLAKELMSYNVLVNTVMPGLIDTPFTRSYPQKNWEHGLTVIPMKRYGRPEEVAGAILFFAGPHSTYITGQTLQIDGGLEI